MWEIILPLYGGGGNAGVRMWHRNANLMWWMKRMRTRIQKVMMERSSHRPSIQCISSPSILQIFYRGEYIPDHHCNMLHQYYGRYHRLLLPGVHEMWTSYIEDLVQIIGHRMMTTIVQHQLLYSLHRRCVYHHMQLIKYVRQWMLFLSFLGGIH